MTNIGARLAVLSLITGLDSSPPEVKAGLTKAAGSGTINKVESLTKGGKLVAMKQT